MAIHFFKGSNDLEWKEAREIAWEKVLEREEEIEREKVIIKHVKITIE